MCIRDRSEREREKQVQHTLSFREIRRKDEGSGRGSQQFIGNINEELSKNTQAEGAIFNNGNVEDKGAGKNDGGRSSSEADSVQISLESVSGTEENISIDEEIERELEEIDSLGIGEEAGFEQASFFFDENTKEIGISDEKRVKNLPSGKKEKYTYLNPKNARIVPHEYIVTVLLKGTGFAGGKERVYNIYKNVAKASEREKLIKKEYGLGGAGWPIENYGLHGYDTFKPQGIRFKWRDIEGEKEGYLSWKSVEEEIGILINKGIYYEKINEEEIIGDYDIPDEVFEMDKKPIADMELSLIHI